jgi:hypothetical protein
MRRSKMVLKNPAPGWRYGPFSLHNLFQFDQWPVSPSEFPSNFHNPKIYNSATLYSVFGSENAEQRCHYER